MTVATGAELAKAGNMEDLARQFIGFIDASQQTVNTYRASIRRMLEFFRTAQITAPTRADILKYRDELRAQYKPATVALHMTACRLFFRWTFQEGYFPNIADHVKGGKLDRGHKKDYLTSTQAQAVLGTATGDSTASKRDRAILALMVTAGLRCIEVARADIGDLRPAGGQMALYIQGKGHEEKGDCVVIIEEVEKVLRDYLTDRGETDPTAPLFVSDSNNSRGQRITTRSISQLVKNHMITAGYNSDRLTAHSLRHTAITLPLLAGKTAQQAQRFARHAELSTTMIYAHNIEDMEAKTVCARAIGDAIFGTR